MKVHYLQHVPFETPAAIKQWAESHGYAETSTMLYEEALFPGQRDYDLLIIMGGPMGIQDEQEYPWLKQEKQFIKDAVGSGKPVIGICLGAQLLAECLGAAVRKNRFKEIGFFDVSLTPIGWNSPIFSHLPATFQAFHWHGDTFEIPGNAYHIASSEACPNQAFAYDDRVVGLQFHVESTRESVEALVRNCGSELSEDSPYIQKPEVILEDARDFQPMHRVLFSFLDGFVRHQQERGII